MNILDIAYDIIQAGQLQHCRESPLQTTDKISTPMRCFPSLILRVSPVFSLPFIFQSWGGDATSTVHAKCRKLGFDIFTPQN